MKAYKLIGEGYTVYNLITSEGKVYTTAVIESNHSINLSITETGLSEEYLISQGHIECDVAEAKNALYTRISLIILNTEK